MSARPQRAARSVARLTVLFAALLEAASAGAAAAAQPSFANAGPTGFGGAAAWTSITSSPSITPAPVEALPGAPVVAAADVTPLTYASRDIMGGRLEGSGTSRTPFGGERARILLRSLTLPGWGQATLGRTTSAWVFGLAELGIWTSFTAFKVQEQMRRDSYEKTALLFAGVNLNGRDEEFRRIVGSYISSDEYNQLVVFRDAANQFYDDPQAYRDYIAKHSIGGANSWSWSSVDELLRYRAQRQREQRAANRANTALALAIGNRILSAIHAARFAHSTPPEARSWQIEYQPTGNQPGDFRVGVRTRF